MLLYSVVLLIGSVGAFPASWIRKIAENTHFDDFENYLPKFGELPKFEYSSDDSKINSDQVFFKNHLENVIDTGKQTNRKGKTMKDVIDFVKEELKTSTTSTISSITTTENGEESTTPTFDSTTERFDVEEYNTLSSKLKIDPLDENSTEFSNDTSRLPRQEDTETNGESSGNESPNAAQEDDEESSEEEDGNMLTGIISAFLGGLSRPDGSVDVEAIVGLLGSLSTQNEDGTYDFNGLTELLMSFFGGGDEEGGGSNFGAFLGGILGAFIKGVAKPPGAKGAGIFTGNLLTAILPALSGPAPTEDDSTKPPQTLDSGGFLSGLLSTVLGSSGGGSSGGTNGGGGGGSKYSIIKAIVSMITGIFTSSSAGKKS